WKLFLAKKLVKNNRSRNQGMCLEHHLPMAKPTEEKHISPPTSPSSNINHPPSTTNTIRHRVYCRRNHRQAFRTTYRRGNGRIFPIDDRTKLQSGDLINPCAVGI